MPTSRSAPVEFPDDIPIKPSGVNKSLRKRSYVDSDKHVFVVLSGEGAIPSAVHIPSKYSKILHIISYRYDVYRHVAAAIRASSTGSNTKPVMKQLCRILQYLDSVRTTYISFARRGGVEEKDWFCPTLEYHLWLDYVEQAYHSDARTAMEKSHGVTFESVVDRRVDVFQSSRFIQQHNTRHLAT